MRILQGMDSPDGTRRVEFFQNSDGTFSFDEFRFDEEENAWCFHVSAPRSFPRTASLEEAVQEARGRINWLAELNQ